MKVSARCGLQFACFVLHAVLWIVFAGIVIHCTVIQTWLACDNFAIVGGADHVMEWWFHTATPLAWGMIVVRVMQNLLEDIRRFRKHEPFVLQASLLD